MYKIFRIAYIKTSPCQGMSWPRLPTWWQRCSIICRSVGLANTLCQDLLGCMIFNACILTHLRGEGMKWFLSFSSSERGGRRKEEIHWIPCFSSLGREPYAPGYVLHPVVQWSARFPGKEETWVRLPAGHNVPMPGYVLALFTNVGQLMVI